MWLQWTWRPPWWTPLRALRRWLSHQEGGGRAAAPFGDLDFIHPSLNTPAVVSWVMSTQKSGMFPTLTACQTAERAIPDRCQLVSLRLRSDIQEHSTTHGVGDHHVVVAPGWVWGTATACIIIPLVIFSFQDVNLSFSLPSKTLSSSANFEYICLYCISIYLFIHSYISV